MPARERLHPVEQLLAYFMGLGIIIAIIAFWLGSLENVDEALASSLLLVGLAVLSLGTIAWLYLCRPWTTYDDLTTPHYSGHHDDPDTALLVPEAAPPAVMAEPALPVPVEEPAAAPPVLVDDLTQLHGVGPKAAEALADAGITNFQQVADMSPDELDTIMRARGVRLVGSTARWPEQARALLGRDAIPVPLAPPDDLTTIPGIGPKVQRVLNDAGIRTYRDLAQSTPDDLRTLLSGAGLHLSNPDEWPARAALADRERGPAEG